MGDNYTSDNEYTRSDVERLFDGGGWQQARIDLSDYSGLDNLRLRIDFTTMGSMQIGTDATGHVLRAVDADQIVDGDTFTIGGVGYEFDLGYVLAAKDGSLIVDGETFIITDEFGTTQTFEFDRGDGLIDTAHIGILVNDHDSSALVATAMAAAIESSSLTGITNHLRGRRVQLEAAPTITVDTTATSFEIEGIPGTTSPVGIPIHWDLPAFELDPALPSMVNAIRPVLASQLTNDVVDAIRVARENIYIVGAPINDMGPLGMLYTGFDPFTGEPISGLEGDVFGEQPATDTARLRGAENEFEGVFIDNLVIGFAARGELVTSAPIDTTFVSRTSRSQITTGDYQLEIRLGEQYTTESAGLDVPIRSIDVLDRLIQGHSFEIAAGNETVDGQTFQIGNLNVVTFEFDNLDVDDGVADGNVSVPYETDWTANEIARSVVATINSSAVRALLPVTAAVTATGTRVDLHGDNGVRPILEPFFDEYNDEVPFAVDLGFEFGETGIFQEEVKFLGTLNEILGLTPTFDVDLLRVELLQGTRITVDIDSVQYEPYNLDSYVRIFDADGVELATNNDSNARDEFADPTLESYLEFTAPANGVYYIGISGFGNELYDPFVPESDAEGDGGDSGAYDITIVVGGVSPVFTSYDDFGDSNQFRDQGQLLIQSNSISHSAGYGIVVQAGDRDAVSDFPHPGSPRVTREINTASLVPGLTIVNNVIAGNETGAIRFSGDPNLPGTQPSAVPFGRIVNNTLYGLGGDNAPVGSLILDVGVLIENNAGPTLLNNIIANFDTPISLDGSSTRNTVVGGTLYKDNTVAPNLLLGDFNIDLDRPEITNKTLFVDPLSGNFYLEAGSLAIDSSIDSLEERPELVRVKNPLGIAPSPILAPQRDIFGLLRVDDPNVEPPAGIGENVFKDRGAIDRVDILGPTVALSEPTDNDILDQDPTDNSVQLLGATLTRFVIELRDAGVGIDDSTVEAQDITITAGGRELVVDVDYRFDYDATNNRIILTPQAGIWLPDNYVVTLDNTSIADLANNSLQPNQNSGATLFNISIGEGLDFGDAPDPGYPTLLIHNGARHVIQTDFYLGGGVDEEIDGQPTAAANGDSGDDGITFNSLLVPDTTGVVTARASQAGRLDAWIDFNGDGDWFDAGEQILTSADVIEGDTQLSFSIPVDALVGTTFARFRYSSAGGLAPTGLANDGEVEDYEIAINDPGIDFGDAPDPTFATLLANDGARHDIVPGFYLGAGVDGEPDGLTTADASGDGLDDDGVTLEDFLVVDATAPISVVASVGGLLDAWIDFNGDGDWDDAGEQIFDSQLLLAGSNALTINVPDTAVPGTTFARFRLSSAGGLGVTGLAADGEVEDYAIAIMAQPPGPFDYGDAPDPGYPTLLNTDGARHLVGSGLFLGASIDDEPNGQPSAAADGDGADEDGVSFDSPLRLEGTATVTVTASAAGLLNAWVDFNADGDWDDAGEQVFVDQSLVAGDNSLTIAVPAGAVEGPTYARFRLNTAGGLSPAGEAADGEVEDYAVTIGPAVSWHNAAFPTDVDDNGIVAPKDAILVINELNDRDVSDPDSGTLPAIADPPPFFDVNDDGYVSPLDAILVINDLPSTTNSPQAPLSASVVVVPETFAADEVVSPQSDLGRAAATAQGRRSRKDAPAVKMEGPALLNHDIALRSIHGESRREEWQDDGGHRRTEEIDEARTVDDFFARL